ncbi:asparagine synthase-related protein [Chryseobacterium salipaludis]|uniref:asparagine synthase-related protein n=1 Tax=Chryseobacterium TaxID=59732 RepID=UPI001FF3BE6C|nr:MULTISPECIES: asparagine synthase-related protein [Chryseobacterium]MCJ8498592.1 asparagine synthase-related protein [Chryseobacterium salipaludis]MCX3297758.1 asparagine synthase-related protein [Planobacterium sp. JC490]
MKIGDINSFLYLGYFLDFQNSKNIIETGDFSSKQNELSKLDENDLLSLAKTAWFRTFEELFSNKSLNVVPISGGIDSRAVLATLQEFTESSNIYTYTFGTENTLDFEIGNLVAKKLQTKHRTFSFSNYKFSTQKEIEISKRTHHQTFLFHHPPLEELDKLYYGANIWSGYMLDWIAGSHLPAKGAETPTAAREKVLKKERFVKSANLTCATESQIAALYDLPDRNPGISYEELIEVYNRYPKYIAPNILYEGYQFILPGNSRNLFNFYFNLPNRYRRNQTLYKKFVFTEFPKIFALPLKQFHGLPSDHSMLRLNYARLKNKIRNKMNLLNRTSINPQINYMDFNTGIRQREDLRTTIHDNLMDLAKRDIVPWIDLPQIYNDHINQKGNYADALITLASLEIHIKAGKQL